MAETSSRSRLGLASGLVTALFQCCSIQLSRRNIYIAFLMYQETVMDKDAEQRWICKDHPPSLFRRLQFDGYSNLRIFLDRLAELSKETKYYPDISFGTDYANITVYASNEKVLSEDDKAFAQRVDELIDPT